MPKNKLMMSGLLAAPLVTILLIAGCSVSSPGPTETPNPSPSISASADPSASPAPTQEPPAAEEPTPGAIVDEATGYQLQKDTNGQFRGYPLPDGTYMVVDRLAPLPAPVQADLDAKAGAAQARNQGGDGTEVISLASTLGLRSGKRVLIVSSNSLYESPDATSPTTIYWVAGAPKAMGGMHSVEEATAAAQAYIESQSNPAEWSIIVAQ